MFVIIVNGPCLLGLLNKHTDSISPYSTKKYSALNLVSLCVPGREGKTCWAPYLTQPLLNIGLEYADRFSASDLL